MNKLILVLLAVLLASTYAQGRVRRPIRVHRKTLVSYPKLQTEDNEASLDDFCELCFGGDETSRVQLEEDAGFDCETITDDCFGEDDGSSE